jgi:hypothetical protein
MEQVQVKIRGTVSTQRYGTLMSGDILRTDAAYAKFLVEECMAGEIIKPAEQVEQPKKRGRKPA